MRFRGRAGYLGPKLGGRSCAGDRARMPDGPGPGTWRVARRRLRRLTPSPHARPGASLPTRSRTPPGRLERG
eukprot:7219393-Lingulodinium_polyedra.AAC.1